MISVAMATYNGGEYLHEQLNSLASQRILPDELIVCDDGSSDCTLNILKDFAKKVPFKVVIIENDHNLGVVRNFEKVCMQCKGDIIFFSDQDDVWFDNKISIVLNIFEKKGDDVHIVINDAIVVDKNLNKINDSLYRNIVRYKGSNEEFITGCCTAISKEFRDICLLNKFRMDMFDEGFHRIGRILKVRYVYEEPLQYYRRHNKNISHSMANAENVSLVNRLSYYKSKLISVTQQKEKYDQWLREQYNETIFILRNLRDRSIFNDQLKLFNKEKIISEYADALAKRILLRDKKPIMRFISVLLLYLRQGYSSFSGYKSMIIDIFK
jgi:glycosyltransferase involved in cell wall biosynthesis